MMAAQKEEKIWRDQNQEGMMLAIGEVRERLKAFIHKEPRENYSKDVKEKKRFFFLDSLCKVFGLSPFERFIILLCLGMEVDHSFPTLCAGCGEDSKYGFPTFGLALALFYESHWSALAPDAPLRKWQLIHLGPGEVLTARRLTLDERLLHFLFGLDPIDVRIKEMFAPLVTSSRLSSSQMELVDEAVRLWSEKGGEVGFPVIQLCGPERRTQCAMAAAIFKALHFEPYVLRLSALPETIQELKAVSLLWYRESLFSHRALLIEGGNEKTSGSISTLWKEAWLHHPPPFLILSTERPLLPPGEGVSTFYVEPSSSDERLAVWHTLVDEGDPIRDYLGELTEQFDLDEESIHAAWEVSQRFPCETVDGRKASLWDSCVMQTRAPLDGLVNRIEPQATWQDIILPSKQMEALENIIAYSRHRKKIYTDWGFGEKSIRGLGLSALFFGGSGTGKTLAAEVIAHTLRLDLYHVDLSLVVSKYIGETEANLKKVFDAAERGGAVLLFDEADALFGKRSEVKDSHDRYANMEVSYLLQQMEAYRGLVILTTNMKEALDNAFTRRIQFMVSFPFPSYEMRLEIWRQIFPQQTPLDQLDFSLAANLNISGGSIRNIALHAAFAAAQAETSLNMEHLLQGVKIEYEKLGKSLNPLEIKRWV